MIPRIDQKILIIAQPGREEEVITRLARVGYDKCIGFLDGGIQAWKKAGKNLESMETINVEMLSRLNSNANINILDVRKKSEFDSQHVLGAINAPLDYVNDSMALVEKHKTYYVHCAGGYRSVIFISILNSRGFKNLINVDGGINSIKQNDRLILSEYVCPTTML